MSRYRLKSHVRLPRKTARAITSATDTAVQPPEQGAVGLNAHYFLFFLMFLVFLGCFSMFRPYLDTILLAVILGFSVSPIHARIERFLGHRKNLAAALTCLLVTIVVIIPLSLILIALIHQGIVSFNAITNWVADGKYQAIVDHPLVTGIYDWIHAKLPDIQKLFPSLDLTHMKPDKLVMDATAAFGRSLLNHGGQLAGNIGSLIAKFGLMIVIFFFVIRDEAHLIGRLLHLIPLSSSQEEQILKKIKDVGKSALLGTLATSLAQGIAGGIAFAICGLPALFWGAVMAFTSLVPVVGTALVWIPAALFLLVSGHWGLALFMTLWCTLVVGGIDNVLRPLFMQGGANMNTLLIFLSILGGLSRFGLMGLLYGPLIVGLALVLIYIYNLEFKEFLSDQDRR
jgi:predicted PurR-regulated permease PerM